MRKRSGIVQDVLINAIPFACSAETALVDFSTEKNGERARTDQEFALDLSKIILNYDYYLRRAILAAAKHDRLLQNNTLRENICRSDAGHSGGDFGTIAGGLDWRAREATAAS